jgi:hypothetical protein
MLPGTVQRPVKRKASHTPPRMGPNCRKPPKKSPKLQRSPLSWASPTMVKPAESGGARNGSARMPTQVMTRPRMMSRYRKKYPTMAPMTAPTWAQA